MVTVDDYAKALADYGQLLAEGIEAALPGWVRASVVRLMTAWSGSATLDADLDAAVRSAGEEAAAAVGAEMRALVSSDVDAQRSTPLAIVRAAVRWPTAVLRAAGVPPVERDAFETSVFPDDDYGLTPATLADLDPELGDIAIAWGAAKAWEHKRRHASG